VIRSIISGTSVSKNIPLNLPLGEFIAETMDILKSSPHATEICVERVKQLRFAESSGHYQKIFTQFNDAITGATSAHLLKTNEKDP